jgi:hypothetical protein
MLAVSAFQAMKSSVFHAIGVTKENVVGHALCNLLNKDH